MASFRRPYLPEDLMIGVLWKLPVKSLLRFRCVSKSWCAIITSRNFRYEHLNNNRDGGFLLAQFYTEPSSGPQLSEYFPDKTLADLSHHAFDGVHQRATLYGPCNGIFLVNHGRHRYALWNPATREYRELPFPGRRPWYVCFESYGFGWDPITEVYKVVIVQQIEHENMNIVAMVHTLGTHGWNLLVLDWAGIRSLYESTCHTYLDGVYYFHFYGKVLALDMATDAIEVIPTPTELEPIRIVGWVPANECLTLFQGTISFVRFSYDENDIMVWMLREKSWIKHLSVRLQTKVKLVIGCWNDEILFQSDADGFLLYKATAEEIRDIGFQATYRCAGILSYKESLISIEEEYEYMRQKHLQALFLM